MLAFVLTILAMTVSAPPAPEPSWSWLEDGKPLQLNRYNQTTQRATEADGTVASRTTLTSPARLTVVTVEQRVYPAPAAGTDTLLRFEQPTAAHPSSAVFSSINTLDKTIAVPRGSSKVVLHTFSGSSQSSMDFMPGQQVLSPGDPVAFTPAGGRSSNGVLPYFGIEIVTAASNGVVFSKF